MKKNLLTTGEFASLCGTQKGTLLFYEKEGLLKPKHVSENRYRRYGVEQFFEFDLLSMLKEVGSSLKEIKAHLHNMNGENFLSFLLEKQLAAEKGAHYLHNMLREVDPASADAIHANNIKRVIRALEFYHQTGTKISEHNEKEREKEAAYRSAYFVLTDERKRL